MCCRGIPDCNATVLVSMRAPMMGARRSVGGFTPLCPHFRQGKGPEFAWLFYLKGRTITFSPPPGADPLGCGGAPSARALGVGRRLQLVRPCAREPEGDAGCSAPWGQLGESKGYFRTAIIPLD